MKLLIISISLLLSLTQAQTEEPDPFSFFPSAVGDKWEYEEGNTSWIYQVVRDSLAEDSSRYIFYFDPPLYYGANYRIDSNHQVVYHPQFNPRIIYELDADSGDTWMVAPEDTVNNFPREQALVADTYNILIFGEIVPAKEIRYFLLSPGDTTITEDSDYMWTDVIVSGFGLVENFNYVDPPKTLVGCIIDGKRYGTLVSVEHEEKLPNELTLKQNYPNPFNGSTIIEYALPEAGEIKLSIYNILGEEVKVIEEDFKSAGTYKSIIELTEFPSGIYVYTLQNKSRTLSKKLVLLK